MKLAAAILSLMLCGCSATPNLPSVPVKTAMAKAQPEAATSDPSPILWGITQTNFQISYPNDFVKTNYLWFFEVADDPSGAWRYPYSPQRPDESNVVVVLHGARYIRLHGIPY